MIIKANIETNPTINVNLKQGMGQGAMSPEDKEMLETLANRPSLTQYFDDAESNILYWNGETAGLEYYKSGYSEFYKVSDVAPSYGNLQDYTIKATYKTRPSSAPSTSVLSIIGDNTEGYCALGTVSSEPAGTQIYAYVMYEDNSLGVSAGTYLNKYYEVSALDVGHSVYEKKVIKEDCLSDKVVESTNQVQNMIKFSGGDTLNWDGKTQGLEVVDTNFYRVSTAIPTFEELSKVFRVSSFIKAIYDWNYYSNLVVNDYRDTEGYCSIDTSGLADNHTLCRVYYRGNAAEVTPGTYFYEDETIYVDELVLGDYGKFTPVLKEECLPESNVEAGTYGGMGRTPNYLFYNIPNVTVDEYGRITEASNSVLPKASAESDGYIGADDYARLSKIPSIVCNYTDTLIAGQTSYTGMFYIEGSDDPSDIPFVKMYGKYNDGTWDRIIPLDYSMRASYNSKTLAYMYYVDISIPEALAYDVKCYAWSNYPVYRYSM